MRKVKDDRSFWVYLLLTTVTLGIYWFVFAWDLVKDVNEACREDGDKTRGVVCFVLLTIVTCGVYGIFWHYTIVARLNKYCKKNNKKALLEPIEWLGWYVLGSVLCGIGSLVAQYKLIELSNDVMNDYNSRSHTVAQNEN